MSFRAIKNSGLLALGLTAVAAFSADFSNDYQAPAMSAPSTHSINFTTNFNNYGDVVNWISTVNTAPEENNCEQGDESCLVTLGVVGGEAVSFADAEHRNSWVSSDIVYGKLNVFEGIHPDSGELVGVNGVDVPQYYIPGTIADSSEITCLATLANGDCWLPGELPIKSEDFAASVDLEMLLPEGAQTTVAIGSHLASFRVSNEILYITLGTWQEGDLGGGSIDYSEEGFSDFEVSVGSNESFKFTFSVAYDSTNQESSLSLVEVNAVIADINIVVPEVSQYVLADSLFVGNYNGESNGGSGYSVTVDNFFTTQDALIRDEGYVVNYAPLEIDGVTYTGASLTQPAYVYLMRDFFFNAVENFYQPTFAAQIFEGGVTVDGVLVTGIADDDFNVAAATCTMFNSELQIDEEIKFTAYLNADKSVFEQFLMMQNCQLDFFAEGVFVAQGEGLDYILDESALGAETTTAGMPVELFDLFSTYEQNTLLSQQEIRATTQVKRRLCRALQLAHDIAEGNWKLGWYEAALIGGYADQGAITGATHFENTLNGAFKKDALDDQQEADLLDWFASLQAIVYLDSSEADQLGQELACY